MPRRISPVAVLAAAATAAAGLLSDETDGRSLGLLIVTGALAVVDGRRRLTRRPPHGGAEVDRQLRAVAAIGTGIALIPLGALFGLGVFEL